MRENAIALEKDVVRSRCSRPRSDGRTTLGSQPTLSRLEHAIDRSAIQSLARIGIDWFCAYAYGPDEHPPDLILDLDSTDDPTHGTQQLALVHGWYDQHMYHPLVWFEGRTGLLLRTRLRPGRDASATGVVDELRHILPLLRRRFPHTPIFLRADAGMATPAVEAKLEAEGVSYVLGIGTSRVFKARVAPLVARAQARYERRGQAVHLRTSFRHRAKSWPHPRRILVKIDVTAAGLNVRFMVTNRCGRAADLVAWYDDRGTSENWIRELKLDLHVAPQLSSFPRQRLPPAAVQPRLPAARLFPARGPCGDATRVGDHRADSSPRAMAL
ncbi:MAG: IS1380 family transposase [Acidobacteria bacterium]|nr:MAG: IS1380 family transposase [Acidobacteriota bacterium]